MRGEKMDDFDLIREYNQLLINTFVFGEQLRLLHFLLRGNFIAIHPFLGEDYQSVSGSIDGYSELAIHTMGITPDAPIANLDKSTLLFSPDVSHYEDAMAVAIQGHQLLANQANGLVKPMNNADYPDVGNFLTDRYSYHNKKAWFYREQLGVSKPVTFASQRVPAAMVVNKLRAMAI